MKKPNLGEKMPKNNSVNDPGVPHLPLSGGTMTGNLLLNGDPTTPVQAATKSYVDAQNGGAIGSLQYFANSGGDATFTALGWKKCDGSILSQASYPALYAQVGLLNAPAQDWHVQQSSFATTSIYAIAYGNGTFVATAFAGVLASSTDAKNWSVIPSPSAASFTTATYGNGLFYLQTNTAIMTSTDAVTWKTKLPVFSAPVTTVGNMLVYAAGKYVAVGASGSGVGFIGCAAVSTDGVNFINTKNLFPSNFWGINYGNSLWVAGSVLGQVYTSTDALTWTQRTTNANNTVQALLYTTKWVGAGDAGTLQTSTNAIAWVNQTTPTTSSIYCLAYGNSLHVYGGQGGTLATSTDAVTWTARTSGTTSTIATMTYGASVYVYGAVGGVIASSTNATTWTVRTSGTTSTVNNMIYANSLFVYCTSGGGIGTSTDGTTWTARTSGVTGNLWGLCWDGALYHAMGSGIHLTSTNAIAWSAIAQYPSGFGTPVCAEYGTSSFLVGDSSGNVATTTDSITWGTPQTTGTSSSINVITQGLGIYVAAASSGYIATSTNAATWTARTNPVLNLSISAGTFGTLFMLAGSFGGIITSTDGITWVKKTNPFPNTQILFTDAVYANGIYAIGGTPFGPLYTSTDLNTWTQVLSNPANYVMCITVGGGLFAVGYSAGVIATSPSAYPYNTSTQFQLPIDNQAAITYEGVSNFQRSLYIKAT